MNKEQVKGVVKEVAGKFQKKIGEGMGSAKQQAKGAAKIAEGKSLSVNSKLSVRAAANAVAEWTDGSQAD